MAESPPTGGLSAFKGVSGASPGPASGDRPRRAASRPAARVGASPSTAALPVAPALPRARRRQERLRRALACPRTRPSPAATTARAARRVARAPSPAERPAARRTASAVAPRPTRCSPARRTERGVAPAREPVPHRGERAERAARAVEMTSTPQLAEGHPADGPGGHQRRAPLRRPVPGAARDASSACPKRAPCRPRRLYRLRAQVSNATPGVTGAHTLRSGGSSHELLHLHLVRHRSDAGPPA